MLTNLDAIQQQNGYIEPVAARQLRIVINVLHADGRQGQRRRQVGKVRQQLLTQLAALTRQHSQLPRRRWLSGTQRTGATGLAAPASGWGRKDSAIRRTVSGGTSPTAVTR